jgi:hypothetical protein
MTAFASMAPARPASSIGSLAMSRRTCSAACVISITN